TKFYVYSTVSGSQLFVRRIVAFLLSTDNFRKSWVCFICHQKRPFFNLRTCLPSLFQHPCSPSQFSCHFISTSMFGVDDELCACLCHDGIWSARRHSGSVFLVDSPFLTPSPLSS